jgi:hypothetical protein
MLGERLLREIAEEFKCCIETIRRALIRMGFTLKKNGQVICCYINKILLLLPHL